jgi:hypothetical protein
MELYTLVLNGEVTSGLTLIDAYAIWKVATGNAAMMKDEEFNTMYPETVEA